ncbi:hypothetical protein H9P43_008378 [Blastocladiella emersonii ATCC 22665]|nr:hypothetical protein H9P43_008378 [Blastocladiella emersonii ATCC 22665]
MLKRSNGVHDLTSLPASLNFEVHVVASLRFAPAAPPVPLTLDALQTVKQLKFALRHLVPVDYESPRVSWTVLTTGENQEEEAEKMPHVRNDSAMELDHNDEGSAAAVETDEAHARSPAMGTIGGGATARRGNRPPSVVEVPLGRDRDYDSVYEVLRDGDVLEIELVAAAE